MTGGLSERERLGQPRRSLKAQVSLCPLPAPLPSPPQSSRFVQNPHVKKYCFFSIERPKKLEL